MHLQNWSREVTRAAMPGQHKVHGGARSLYELIRMAYQGAARSGDLRAVRAYSLSPFRWAAPEWHNLRQPPFVTRRRRSRRLKKMLRKLGVAISALGFAAGALASDTPVQAQGLKVGVLTCNVASGFGFMFGSSRAVNCTFSPTRG